MQKDFHFYCIGALARAAGFSEKDAITLAYSSEYVDGATESEPIKVGTLIFDPVRTAHNGLKAWNWGIQKKVYFPFHFIPPKPVEAEGDTYVTEANSKFANDIFAAAAAEEDQDLRLYRMGVALHSLADTWAHQGFSGIEESVNDVEALYLMKQSGWNHLFWENLFLDIMPHIGHGQAGKFPDESHLTWKYTRGSDNSEVMHQNNQEFMLAAKKIFELLKQHAPVGQEPLATWAEIEPKIQALFDKDDKIEKKCDAWKAEFGNWFPTSNYHYDRLAWRKDALGDDDVDWDKDDPKDFRKRQYPMKPGFATKPWVMFHRAAEKQRHYVMEKML